MEYKDKVIWEESINIAIDFDGVIHSFEKGYYDGTIYGTPIPGSLDAIKELSKRYHIIIYTTKAKSDRTLVDGKTSTELVWEWLTKYGVADYVSEVTAEKPRAICYIDDKAIRFINWGQTLEEIKNEGI